MTYLLLICGPCSIGKHSDCGGKNGSLNINGEQIKGECQCPNLEHSSVRPKVKENEDVNQIARNQ